MYKRASDLAYLLDNIGRAGIADMLEKYNISPNHWRVKFFKPDYIENYQIAINPRKINQKPHQKINNFYFIYKSPRAMLVTAESTWDDV